MGYTIPVSQEAHSARDMADWGILVHAAVGGAAAQHRNIHMHPVPGKDRPWLQICIHTAVAFRAAVVWVHSQRA